MRTSTYLIRWVIFVIPVAALVGSLVALFLWMLDVVTAFRLSHTWLLFFLPLAGVFIWWIYRICGKDAEKGTNLVLDEIHQPGAGVPLRMAPLVLAGTVITHLFGGSAGREGTAVQMGGSIAGRLSRWFRLDAGDTGVLLTTGIAAGFGAVFGTPVTGAIFALEVLSVARRRISAKPLLPCFLAAFLADIVCKAWGIHHTAYHINLTSTSLSFYFIHLNLLLLGKAAVAGICFGIVGWMFVKASHGLRKMSRQFISPGWLSPLIGGLLIIGLTFAVGSMDYLGLGVSNPDPKVVTIVSSFQPGGAAYFSWFWKLLFTVVTLGLGFKGGEVTPLFFIGAALGHVIGVVTGAPVDLMAGLGFIAVFAGATKTPVACTLMGIELFGGEHVFYYAVACFLALWFSGRTGIYTSKERGKALQRSARHMM